MIQLTEQPSKTDSPTALAGDAGSRLSSELHRVRSSIRYYEKCSGQRSKKSDAKLVALKLELKHLLESRRPKKSKYIIPTKGRYRRGSRTRLTGGISRGLNTGGTGHSCIRWRVSLTVNGESRVKTFAEDKYGKDGAKMLCSLYRMAWMIEEGLWNPKDGDPFAVLGAGEFFSGREDMENTGCDYETMQQMRGALE